ncbi:MAG: dTDP-glucose 4,6-dehydratase [Bacteroidetes bacterium]|nr:dTDP-glucose 4,6-dehydratase [Bacteroidota bacterium]
MADFERKILITGGAGFIGSHVVRIFVDQYPQYQIVNLDKLTYAGNLENLKDVEGKPNYTFVKADITDEEQIEAIFNDYKFDSVVHLAAESHVDRSIHSPKEFIMTNIVGTVNLLNSARASWGDGATEGKNLFYHISTDEVYGSLGAEGLFTETTPYDPHSPYSASKASSDHIVRAYFHTYGLPIIISNCSNNYGPNQFPEKLIPLMVHNLKQRKALPVYGKGENVRDWLYVGDHAAAIDLLFHKGTVGETYNIGGSEERNNLELVKQLCRIYDELQNDDGLKSEELIEFVQDRPGHDFRYAIDSSKIQNELGWKPAHTFEQGMKSTVKWYLENEEWLNNVTSGEYKKYYELQYNTGN